jgi:hypothetical protein
VVRESEYAQATDYYSGGDGYRPGPFRGAGMRRSGWNILHRGGTVRGRRKQRESE